MVATGAVLLIARGLNRQLRTLCLKLADHAKDLEGLGQSVTVSSQDLAGSTTRQAASLQEVSATLEEMSAISKTKADGIGRTKVLADGMLHAADTGSRDISAMATAMDAIKTSSDNIAKIIKTIDETAFQTNILALNAAARETAERIEDSVKKSREGVVITQKVTTSFAEFATKEVRFLLFALRMVQPALAEGPPALRHRAYDAAVQGRRFPLRALDHLRRRRVG
jgi:methyl-accepting chemotaxis protein